MSCFDLMYQSYTTYIPYQRPSSFLADSPPLKKWKMNRMESLLAESSPYFRADRYMSTGCSVGVAGITGSSCSVGEGSGGRVGSLSCSGTELTDYAAVRSKASMLERNSTYSRLSGDVALLPPIIVMKSELDSRCLDSGASSDSGAGGRLSESTVERPTSTHVVSDNCVLMTYFTGDINANIDDHFSRSLAAPPSTDMHESSRSCEEEASARKDQKKNSHCITSSSPSSYHQEVFPMSQRNLPASFWNCNSSSYRLKTTSGGWSSLMVPSCSDINTSLSSSSSSSTLPSRHDPYASHFNHTAAAALHHGAKGLGSLHHHHHRHHHLQDPWKYPPFGPPPPPTPTSAYGRYHHIHAVPPPSLPPPAATGPASLHEFSFGASRSASSRTHHFSSCVNPYKSLFSPPSSTGSSSSTGASRFHAGDNLCGNGGSAIKSSDVWSTQYCNPSEAAGSATSYSAIGCLPLSGGLDILPSTNHSETTAAKDMYWF